MSHYKATHMTGVSEVDRHMHTYGSSRATYTKGLLDCLSKIHALQRGVSDHVQNLILVHTTALAHCTKIQLL